MKPKDPFLALLWSVVYLGLGHIYAGKRKKGYLLILLITGVAFFIPIFAAIYILETPGVVSVPLLLVLVGLGFIVVTFEIYVYVSAYRSARSFNKQHSLESKTGFFKRMLIILMTLFFALGIRLYGIVSLPTSLYVRVNFVQAFKIPSGAMMPTIEVGDRIFSDKRIYRKGDPKRGDIIIFKYPEDPSKDFIKRVVGLPGETIEIKDETIYVNGNPVSDHPVIESVTYYNDGPYGSEGQLIEIPEEHYYVLGDNSVSSRDSRYWGFVSRDAVFAKAIKIWWPLERSRLLE